MRWEDALEIADDAGRVGDDVGREQDAVERAVADADLQRVELDGAIQAEQAADAEEREPVAQLDRHELRDDDEQEREAVACRRAGASTGCRPRAPRRTPANVELERARVLAALGLELRGTRRP